MIKPIVYPYKMGSGSAGVLAEGLNARRVYPDRNYRGYANHVAINWGNSAVPQWAGRVKDIINSPEIVARTTNKLSYFNHLHATDPEVIPRFATSREGAVELFNHGKVVVARTVLNGHSGNGIVLCKKPEDLVDARLYTLHCRHKDEYRIHVFDGKVISEQQKRRRTDVEEVETLVRNVDNGWVFCREDLSVPDAVRDVAIIALRASGLVFGAVDVAYRAKEDRAYALEINTAPNIVNTTAEHYIKAFSDYLDNY